MVESSEPSEPNESREKDVHGEPRSQVRAQSCEASFAQRSNSSHARKLIPIIVESSEPSEMGESLEKDVHEQPHSDDLVDASHALRARILQTDINAQALQHTLEHL